MHPPAQVLPVFAVAYTEQHLGVCGGRTMTLHGVRGTDRPVYRRPARPSSARASCPALPLPSSV